MKQFVDMMKVIARITDESLGLKPKRAANYSLRRASRAVIINQQNQIALMYSRKYRFYKLPGGGIERGENIKGALRREILEETGYEIEIRKYIGMVREERSRNDLRQVSYCFLVNSVGKQKKLTLTEKEKDKKFELRMADSFKNAIRLIKSSRKGDRYEGTFVVRREIAILQKAKEIVSG